jgi:hypothetical protein
MNLKIIIKKNQEAAARRTAFGASYGTANYVMYFLGFFIIISIIFLLHRYLKRHHDTVMSLSGFSGFDSTTNWINSTLFQHARRARIPVRPTGEPSTAAVPRMSNGTPEVHTVQVNNPAG